MPRTNHSLLQFGPAAVLLLALLLLAAEPTAAQVGATTDAELLNEARAAAGAARPTSYPATDAAPDRYGTRSAEPAPNDAVRPAAYPVTDAPVPAAYEARPAALAPNDAAKPVQDYRTSAGESRTPALPPKGTALARSKKHGDAADQIGAAGGLPSVTTLVGSTCLVLSLFFVVAWLMKRGLPNAMRSLPAEVVDVLGRSVLAKGQHVHLVRCGSRLLLVAVSPAGAETLTEITDPIEVDRLAGLCGRGNPAATAASFRQALAQFSEEPAVAGLAGERSRRVSASVETAGRTTDRERRHA